MWLPESWNVLSILGHNPTPGLKWNSRPLIAPLSGILDAQGDTSPCSAPHFDLCVYLHAVIITLGSSCLHTKVTLISADHDLVGPKNWLELGRFGAHGSHPSPTAWSLMALKTSYMTFTRLAPPVLCV